MERKSPSKPIVLENEVDLQIILQVGGPIAEPRLLLFAFPVVRLKQFILSSPIDLMLAGRTPAAQVSFCYNITSLRK